VVLKGVAAQKIVSARAVVPKVAAMPVYRCAFYEGLYGWLEGNGPHEGP
jgi:hypothetical protein